MANKLTQSKIDQMWIAWQEKQTCHYVAVKCHISRPTVRRYRDLEKWPQRFAQIKSKTAAKADSKQADFNAKCLRIAEGVINIYGAGLVGHTSQLCPNCGHSVEVAVPKIEPSTWDFAKMVEIIKKHLGGGPAEPQKLIIEHILPEKGTATGKEK